MEISFPAWVRADGAGALLFLYVQPGASKTHWAGEFGVPARLKLRVQAPPVEGAANHAVMEHVASWAKVRRSEVRLVRGEKSRQKDLWLPLSPAALVSISLS